MNESSPQIKIDVDPTNPGQFFACCGLLELADRLTGKAEGWFEKDKNEFVINAETDLETLTQKIVHAQMKFLDKDDEADNTKKIQIQKDSAVLIGEPFMIRIDWWKKSSKDGKEFKNWAGRQKIHNILNCLRDSLKEIVKNRELDVIYYLKRIIANLPLYILALISEVIHQALMLASVWMLCKILRELE